MESGRLLCKQIEDLPNEIILQILRNLEIKDLIRCNHVSKRIRSISYNETLWHKINLYGCKKVPMELLHLAVKNGCKYLSLEWAFFDSTLSFNSKDFFTKPTQLKYLILSNAEYVTKFYCQLKRVQYLTVSFQSIEIPKKVFGVFDIIFHVYLMRGFQKYGRN